MRWVISTRFCDREPTDGHRTYRGNGEREWSHRRRPEDGLPTGLTRWGSTG
jgi:hypothetical protein